MSNTPQQVAPKRTGRKGGSHRNSSQSRMSRRDEKNEMKATDRYLSMVSDDYRERVELKNGKPHLHALYAICWKLGFTVNGLKPLRYV